MYIPRSEYLSGDYSPSTASQYTYGSVIPNPLYTLKRKMDFLKSMPGDKSSISADNFQRFLLLQSNPEVLGLSKMKLPNTPFGNMSSYVGMGYSNDSDQ